MTDAKMKARDALMKAALLDTKRDDTTATGPEFPEAELRKELEEKYASHANGQGGDGREIIINCILVGMKEGWAKRGEIDWTMQSNSWMIVKIKELEAENKRLREDLDERK